MNAGEELFRLFLTEWKSLDFTLRFALVRALDAPDSWDDLPSDLQAALEAWAALFVGDDAGP